jgi:toxin ParE1/3/4
MTVDYAKRATSDLSAIGAASLQQYGPIVAAEIETFFHHVIAQIAIDPSSRPQLVGRRGIHVAVLVRYPFKIFYRVLDDHIRILHVRHTAQRPWEGN